MPWAKVLVAKQIFANPDLMKSSTKNLTSKGPEP